MNKNLADIFYDPKVGLQSFAKFRAKVKELYPNYKTKDIKQFYDNQEINQLAKKPTVTSTKMYKINGPELSFQIDLMFIPKAIKTQEEKKIKAKKEGLFPTNKFYCFLLCIDILSRKGYVYSMVNKNKESIVSAYKEFLDDVKQDADKFKNTLHYFERDKPFAIVTDDGFDFDTFNNLNNRLDIYVDSSTAYNDHITGGDRLGLIDRLVRTVKNTFMRFVYATKGSQYSVKQILADIVDNYNNTPHRSLDGLTPNEAFSNKNVRMKIFSDNLAHNNFIEGNLSFNLGDVVRVLNRKEAFSKEKPQFSKELYKVVEQRGYKFYVEELKTDKKLRRGLKPNEILKVNEETIQNKNPVNVEKQLTQNRKKAKTKEDLKRLDINENNIVATKRAPKPNRKYQDI
jgi:hypothetical protein